MLLRGKFSLLSHANQKRQVNDTWMSLDRLRFTWRNYRNYAARKLCSRTSHASTRIYLLEFETLTHADTLQHGKWIELLWGEKFVRDTLCCSWRGASSSSSRIEAKGKESNSGWGENPENHLKFNYVIARKTLEQSYFDWPSGQHSDAHVNGKKLFVFLHARRLSKLSANL